MVGLVVVSETLSQGLSLSTLMLVTLLSSATPQLDSALGFAAGRSGEQRGRRAGTSSVSCFSFSFRMSSGSGSIIYFAITAVGERRISWAEAGLSKERCCSSGSSGSSGRLFSGSEGGSRTGSCLFLGDCSGVKSMSGLWTCSGSRVGSVAFGTSSGTGLKT